MKDRGDSLDGKAAQAAESGDTNLPKRLKSG